MVIPYYTLVLYMECKRNVSRGPNILNWPIAKMIMLTYGLHSEEWGVKSPNSLVANKNK